MSSEEAVKCYVYKRNQNTALGEEIVICKRREGNETKCEWNMWDTVMQSKQQKQCQT